jgi:hypothetical protein
MAEQDVGIVLDTMQKTLLKEVIGDDWVAFLNMIGG